MNRASTVYSANPKRSEGSGRELGTHKRSCPDLKHQTTGCNVWPGPERSEGPASGVLPLCTARTRSAVRVGTHKAPSQGIGRELGTHKRSCPDLKHQTTGCNVWPGPERSEGPASGVLPLCTARTRSAVRVPCPDSKHWPAVAMLS